MKVSVGDTVRIDHGDKVVERFVTKATAASVTTESRWMSGAPYVWGAERPHPFRWTCSIVEWAKFVKGIEEEA